MLRRLRILAASVVLAGLIVPARANVTGPTWQTAVTTFTVSVPAGQATKIWTAIANTRTLRIDPLSTSCLFTTDGTPASAASEPLLTGYVWTVQEPPPATDISAYCPSATTIYVTQGQ